MSGAYTTGKTRLSSSGGKPRLSRSTRQSTVGGTRIITWLICGGSGGAPTIKTPAPSMEVPLNHCTTEPLNLPNPPIAPSPPVLKIDFGAVSNVPGFGANCRPGPPEKISAACAGRHRPHVSAHPHCPHHCLWTTASCDDGPPVRGPGLQFGTPAALPPATWCRVFASRTTPAIAC